MASSRSDLDLLAAWRAGHVQAGTRLFKRHFPGVRRFAQTTVGARFVEPLVQRVFVSCLDDERLGASSFRVALFARAHALVGEHDRLRWTGETPLDVERLSVAELCDRCGLERVPLAHSESRALLDALQRIPLAMQVVLQLRYWEQLSSAELAEIFGLEVAELLARLEHARTRLEQALGRSSPAELLETLRDLDERGVIEDPQLVALMPISLGGCQLLEHRVELRAHHFDYRGPTTSIELCLARRQQVADEPREGEPLTLQGYRGRWSWDAGTREGRARLLLGVSELSLRAWPVESRERILELIGELELPVVARAAGLMI